jgi:hypothetical protein
MSLRYASFLLFVGVILVSSTARAKTPFRSRTHFNPAQIGVTTNSALRSFISGGQLQSTRFGKRALRAAGKPTIQLAAGVHRLMPKGPQGYEKTLITPSHVALVHSSGLIELIRRPDAQAQISSRKVTTGERFSVGIGGRGFPIMARKGPADTVLLYRQLPVKSGGQISSTDINTSFALSKADAFHPFGKQGKTVRLAMPRKTFNDAVEGKKGAVGWNNFGDGYSTGLEVLTEVQIQSNSIRKLFQ